MDISKIKVNIQYFV